MRGTTAFLFLSLLLLAAPLAGAVGISPGYVILDAAPGLTETVTYYALAPSAPGDTLVSVGLKETTNPIVQYVTVQENHLLTVPQGGSAGFQVYVKLPDPLPDDLIPGQNEIWVGVNEQPSATGSGFNVLTNQYGLLRINVPYPGLYVNLLLRAPETVDQGKAVPLSLEIKSQGTQTINSAKASIELIANGETITTLPTKVAPNILPGETRALEWPAPTKGMASGHYRAVAHVDFDGQLKDTENEFRIGTEDLTLTNYTKAVQTGSIRKFDVTVSSLWNNPLSNVYADIRVYDGKTLIETLKTPAVESFTPWSTQTLTAFLDASALTPGEYRSEIVLHFSGKEKKGGGKLSILAPGQVESPGIFSNGSMITWGIFLGLLIAILIAVNVYLLLKRRK